MANFILIGAGGYIAPRHMDAIKHLGHKLIAAFDPSDSVGILDSYFPETAFFTKFEDLNAFVKKSGLKVDYVSICSPNYLHFEQIAWTLKLGADAICEKPMVLTVKELDQLGKLEKE